MKLLSGLGRIRPLGWLMVAMTMLVVRNIGLDLAAVHLHDLVRVLATIGAGIALGSLMTQGYFLMMDRILDRSDIPIPLLFIAVAAVSWQLAIHAPDLLFDAALLGWCLVWYFHCWSVVGVKDAQPAQQAKSNVGVDAVSEEADPAASAS